MSEIALLALHQIAKDLKISLHDFVRSHAHLLNNNFLNCADILAQETFLRIDKLRLKKYFDHAANIIEHNANLSSFIVSYGDVLYPKSLRDLEDFPFFFFFRGNANLLVERRCITIVGTRNPNVEAIQCAIEVAQECAAAQYCILSGLAAGIDRAAHAGALYIKGKTLAVLGTNLNYIYPFENRPLAKSILAEGGAILSEYPIPFNHSIHSDHMPIQFIQRNRILAALSTATIVIQSSSKGGTMHTVRFAKELGRWMFVWQMPEYLSKEPVFAGNQHLIQNGMALAFDHSSKLVEMLTDHHSKPFLPPMRQTQLF